MHWINHQLHIAPLNAFIDPAEPVERAIITHGHSDHARPGHKHVLATPQTIAIMQHRYGKECAGSFQALPYGRPLKMDAVTITFYPAGHVLGSAQVLLEYKNQRVVVTGDYKTKPDSTVQPFELVPCDLFVTEATFGLPVFQHPEPQAEIAKLLAAMQTHPERAYVIGAYALGKAQRVIKLVREAGYQEPVYLHGALTNLCDYYRDEGIDLGLLENMLTKTKEELKGSLTIAPPSALKDQWSRRLPDPVTGYASGWMSVKQRAKQSLVEMPLVISDHADWNELTATIKATGAETIWITHGREEALVHWCKQQGLQAEPLSIQGWEEEITE